MRRVAGAQGPADEAAAARGDGVAQEDPSSRESRKHSKLEKLMRELKLFVNEELEEK